MSGGYRHDRACMAIVRARDRYALEEWRQKGHEVCPWCGTSFRPHVAAPLQTVLAEFIRRFAEEPKAWEAVVFELGNPTATVADLAAFLKCSQRTAERVRKRARELARGAGLADAARLTAGGEGAGGVGTTEALGAR